MKIYTVLETRFEHKPTLDYVSCLDGWSNSYSSEENALKGFKSMVRKAVKEFYTRHQESGDIEAIVATIISRVLNGNEGFAAWENKDESYVWKISSEYVDNRMDPLPPRSENKDEPVKPEEAKIGFKLKDKVTYEVYTYKFRRPAMAEAFAESIRRVMEPTTTPMGVFVWNPVKGERSVDDVISGMTWDDLLNELRLAATPNSEFERTEVGAEMLSHRNWKYPEFYPGNVWSILLKHTSTLVVNVKAKTLDEAIERAKAKGETNDWFADYGIWAWDGDGEPVEVDRKSCHAAPGEEEDF